MFSRKIFGVIALVAAFLVIVTIVIIQTSTRGKKADNYGIVIDAGSTHTGITVYRWPGEKDKCTGVVEQVWSEELKEAMATYENETQFGFYLLPYIVKAKSNINEKRMPMATLYLGATAGMRLLRLKNDQSAEIRLNTTREALELHSGLTTKNVSIISGEEEGLFAWISTNYLLNKLRDSSAGQPTTGILDMGGASEQIAHEIATNETSDDGLINVKLYGTNHTVNVSSNICYGFNEVRGRLVLYLIENYTTSAVDPCLPKNANYTYSGRVLRESVCLNGTKSAIIDANKNYTFTGSANPDECDKLVQKVIDINECRKDFAQCRNEMKKPIPASDDFIAMSGYYYTLRVLNLTDNKILKHDYWNQATQFCQLPIEEVENEKWVVKKYAKNYCFQLIYIYHTIDNVYKFEGNWSNIEYKNKAEDTNLGWSLGYMIKATNAIPVENPSPPLISTWLFIFILILSILLLAAGIVLLCKSINKTSGPSGEVYEPIHQQA